MTPSFSGSWKRRWRVAPRKREVPTPELRCPTCAAEVQRFWSNCSNCGRRLEWRDTTKETGAECYYCGWVVSDSFSFCPWCGRDIADRDSSPEPLKAPKGFKYHRRCQWGCGGGVMYPMRSCPWCGRPQKWRYQERSEEHTSELQSRLHLVCRLLLEKKKTRQTSDNA